MPCREVKQGRGKVTPGIQFKIRNQVARLVCTEMSFSQIWEEVANEPGRNEESSRQEERKQVQSPKEKHVWDIRGETESGISGAE